MEPKAPAAVRGEPLLLHPQLRCRQSGSRCLLAANQHPDHATIAEFRRRHLEALACLFVQVLRLCEKAGLVHLGMWPWNGTKMRANASKHKAISYSRMEEKVRELEAQVSDLLAAVEAEDQADDAQHGARLGDAEGIALPAATPGEDPASHGGVGV